MPTEIKPLVAGNWKMNGTKSSLSEIKKILESSHSLEAFVDLLICPPTTILHLLNENLTQSSLMLGGQDCHSEQFGAYTGDISAEMLRDVGASYVIVGHSERRVNYLESDELVQMKVCAAWRAKLTAIVCIGETLEQRESGATKSVVLKQLKDSIPEKIDANLIVVAYEPVWAIGSGLTPTKSEVADVHNFIRKSLVDRFGSIGGSIRLLYGGSVKPENAASLIASEHVNGALVGGASLKAVDFLGIANAFCNH